MKSAKQWITNIWIWINNIWIFRIFADEFGSSDVRSNYSRVYSWMANQLGHFTLGLMTASIFYWLAYDAGTWVGLIIACLATVILVLVVDHDIGLHRLTLVVSSIVLLALVTSILYFLLPVTIDTICSCDISSYASDCKTAARFTVTCVMVAILVWFIARKDRYFPWLGLIAVLGTLAIAPGIFIHACIPVQYVGVCITIVAILCYECKIYFSSKSCSPKFPPLHLDKLVFIVAILGAFVGLVVAFLWRNGEQPTWTAAVVSALISMTIWISKEFGGDMPNVTRELHMACSERKQSSSTNCITDEGKCLDKDYLETAKWDSRTDTMFYLAGAWVAAGIIIDSQSAQNDLYWLAPVVIWTGVAFLIWFFLKYGKIWAYRQQAIDRTGATHGNMMAVIGSRIKLFDDKCNNQVDEPRVKLYHFARGDADGSCSLQHLVVFGDGRHNERLADALVTEAALASLPLKWFCKLKAECQWRKARKLSFARLRDYDPKNLTVRELLYNPVKDLYIEAKGKPKGDRRVVKVTPKECETCASERQSCDSRNCKDYEKVGAASLVVVTRCKPDALCDVVAKLSKRKCQNTVWCFDKKYMDCKEKIFCSLRSKLGDIKIGVVHCC